MSKPIKMEFWGEPISGSNPSEKLARWEKEVSRVAREKVKRGKTINGDCHLYVAFFLRDEGAFGQVDVDNLLMPFCGSLQKGGVIGEKADILGIKAHKGIARDYEIPGAVAMLIPTQTLNIKNVKECIPGSQFYPSWQREMQLIETDMGEFIDNMPGKLWGFRDEDAEPGFNWRALRGKSVRGVVSFTHRSKTRWINKWGMGVLAYHVGEDGAVDVSDAPKHIKFGVYDSKGAATKSSSHLTRWKHEVRNVARAQVNAGNVIKGDCHLYVVFRVPEGKGADGQIYNFLKVFCDQLKTKDGERGIITDDARILGIKAHKQIVGKSVESGAFAFLIPTETHRIENVEEGVPGREFCSNWQYPMQKITTEGGGVFIDNMPGYLWSYPYPGIEPGYNWKNAKEHRIHGVITYTTKDSETPWINKWDMKQLMQRIPKDRPGRKI